MVACLARCPDALAPGTTDRATMEQMRRENEKKCAHVACLHRAPRSRRASGRYGLSKEYVDSIVLPSPVKTAQTATLERQAQAGGHRAKAKQAKATVKLSLMSAPLDALSDGQCRALLLALHTRLHSLLAAAPGAAAAPVRRVLLTVTTCFSDAAPLPLRLTRQRPSAAALPPSQRRLLLAVTHQSA